MEIPTEEQIDSVRSELEAAACDGSENHVCEMCTFSQAMNARGMKSMDAMEKGKGKFEPPSVDKFALSMIEEMPLLALFGSALARLIMRLGRVCFFAGMKVGRNQEIDRQMSSFMEK